MPSVLYHPHFEPSISWLRTMLLVYDRVYSIVPPEAGYNPSEGIDHHLEVMPETFAPIAPEPFEVTHEYFVLRALKRAFKRIAARPRVAALEGLQVRYTRGSADFSEPQLELAGIVKIHDGKVAYTVHQMLRECGLIYGRAPGGFSYINERAAYLLISLLAQRMAARLPVRTISDVESCFLLSAACNVIESGDPVDSRGVLASSVLGFHIPAEIGLLSDSKFIEIRKRYEGLREIFPFYLRDLGDLIQIDDVRQVPDLIRNIEILTEKIDLDLKRIKKSRVGQSIKRWLPVGIGAAITLGSAFLHDAPSLKYVTGGASIAAQILTEALHDTPVPSRLQGAQSLLLNAKKDILHAREMALLLDMRTAP